jgi:hypothetical protein
MIVKAINQDEFRDFSFINPDWKPHQYRMCIDSGETTALSQTSFNQAGNLQGINFHATTNPISNNSTSASQNVQLIIVRSNSPQEAIDSTSTSSNSTSLNTAFSNTSITPSESSSISHVNDDSSINKQASTNSSLVKSSNSTHPANASPLPFNSNLSANKTNYSSSNNSSKNATYDGSNKILERIIQNTDI